MTNVRSILVMPQRGSPGGPTWAVRPTAGEPSTLDVWTDYAGRCEWARLYVAWREPIASTVLDPAAYAVPPQVGILNNGQVQVEFSPLDNLRVRWLVSAPGPGCLGIELKLANQLAEPREVELYAISALRLKAETLAGLPASSPLRIVRDVLTASVAPGWSLAFGLSETDAVAVRSTWPPLWSAIQSGQGLGNMVTQRPARERYAALATTAVLKPHETRRLLLVQASAPSLDEAQAAARDLLGLTSAQIS